MTFTAMRDRNDAFTTQKRPLRMCAECSSPFTDDAHGSPVRVADVRRPRTVSFPESDFVIRVRHGDHAGQPCAVVVSATVRAMAPRLDTWWCGWEAPIAPGASPHDVADEEVRRARGRFLRLLTEPQSGQHKNRR